MKILHVMAGGTNGGAELFFVDAIAALAAHGGADVVQYALTRPENTARLKALDTLGVAYETASFSSALPFLTRYKLRKSIREFKPDIVHYWMSRAASFAVKGTYVNVGWYSSYFKIKRYKNCDIHIGVTQDVAAYVIAQGIDPARVYALEIYTKDVKADAARRADLDTPEGVPVLLSLARLHPVKGLDVLLRALVDVPPAYLWMAGDGPMEGELKALAAQLGVADRVRFLGWRTDREALLAGADVCVFPSRNDSFGAVMIEAWAAGVPLVAAKAPGPRAYIRDGQDGILCAIDDASGLADAINRVLGDAALRAALVKNGRARYEADFTARAFAEKAMTIYRQGLEMV